VWFENGCALHRVQGEAGFKLFDGWSQRSKKYEEHECRKKWEEECSKVTGYGLGTIFHHANAADPGWRDAYDAKVLASIDAAAHDPEVHAFIMASFEAANENEPDGQKTNGGAEHVIGYIHGRTVPQPAPEPPPKRSLDEVHEKFRQWLGEEYDLDAIDAVCAVAAAEKLTGDPAWLLIVSGPGAAKTETAQALAGAGAHVTSTIASEGALLSGTARRQRAKTATGGLLRKIGACGILVIKDVTSILSADRNTRASVLAAIREIHDGRYERNVGTDGGQTLTWVGRIVIVGAVTTAWDAAHAVVATMGDRFVLIRINSRIGRLQSGKQAIGNTGREPQMRQELAAVVGGLVAHACTDDVAVTKDENDQLLKAADIVTMARTAVERDYQGEVIDAHAPEMPTRFAKQLTQILRGGVAIGMDRKEAMRLAIRCARDSIPPLRLDILLDIAANPNSRPGDVRHRIKKPWTTTKREMDGLTMIGVLECIEETIPGKDNDEKKKTVWRYTLAAGFDDATLLDMAGPQKEEPMQGGKNHRQEC
jgi:hypothetical protein